MHVCADVLPVEGEGSPVRGLSPHSAPHVREEEPEVEMRVGVRRVEVDGGPELCLGPRLVELAQLAREKVSEHDVRGGELQGEVVGTLVLGIGPLNGADDAPEKIGDVGGRGAFLQDALVARVSAMVAQAALRRSVKSSSKSSESPSPRASIP